MPERMPNWLVQRAHTGPDHPALICEHGTVSYAELARRAAASAARLHHCGVRSGDRVVLLMRNRLDFVEALHAVTRLGAIAVPLGHWLTAPEIAERVQDCQPRLVLCEASTAPAVGAAGCDRPVSVVNVETDALAGEPRSTTAIAPDDGMLELDAVHSIIYTSGSTGRAKGVLLTHRNYLWSATASALNLGVHAEDRWLACLPFCHVGGLSILLRSVLYGTTAVVHDGFEPQRVNDAIDRDRVTIISVVANMLQRLLDARGARPYPPWLRCVLLGGGPAPGALLEAAAARGVPVIQTYGLTEAASQVATLSPRDALRKLGSAGKPLLGVEVQLQGDGDVREILVRGPNISPGYLSDERSGRDGWLATGDMGRMDSDGFLYVVGRRDELIISGGENVYPAEVEAALDAHPAVAEACVFGIPDARWGEAVAACVTLRPGARVTERGLQAHLRRRLAGFKVPRQIRFTAELPRTASGKVLRHTVRTLVMRTASPIAARS